MFEISKPEDADPFAWSDGFWKLEQLKSATTASAVGPEDICTLFKKFDLKDYDDDENGSFQLSEEPRSLFGENPFKLHFQTEAIATASSASLPTEDQTEEVASLSSISETVDVWLDPAATEPPEKPMFLTWDSFLGHETKAPSNSFLTEAASGAFDAALEGHLNDIYSPNEAGSVIRTDVFCYCLLYLAVGRNSILFQFNDEKFNFETTKENIRVTGTTVGTCQNIVSSFMKCGTDMRIIQRFSQSIYSSNKTPDPAMVALAQCSSTVVGAVYQYLAIPFRSVVSIIQLLDSLSRPALVLDCLVRIIERLVDAKNTSQLLSRLFDLVQQLEHRSNWLRPLLLAILARVSEPWLEKISTYIGLISINSMENVLDEDFFVTLEDRDEEDEAAEPILGVNWDRVPGFLLPEAVYTIFVTGMALELLKKFHPKHPLSRGVPSVETPKLHWKFSWNDLEALQAKAAQYEKSVRAAIKSYGKQAQDYVFPSLKLTSQSTDEFNIFSKSKDEVATAFATSISEMNQLPLYSEPSYMNTAPGQNLQEIVLNMLSENQEEVRAEAYAPPLSITPMLSFSNIFAAQARLVNKATMKMIFEEYKIQQHFSVLRRFQLLGDGVFISRLSHALFDDEMDTADRHAGAGVSYGTMGLKLGSRDTWPPASSELRLALMGILSECYHGDEKTSEHYRPGKDNDLPGGLSFTVRDMSEAELQSCMDADSIEALDFLRVQYKPPAPVDAVINPRALYKYDRLFKLLLRVTRMLFVVNAMFKDVSARFSPKQDNLTKKFRIEAHHFVTNVAKYFFETGVSVTWDKFERKLEEIERQARRPDSEGGCEGLGAVMDYHERALDQILFATLSRKRQQPVMKVLKDIFGQVLTFARYINDSKLSSVDMEEKYGEGFLVDLHSKFRKKVAIFINVCRGLSEKRGYGDGKMSSKGEYGSKEGDVLYKSSDSEEGGMLGQLLVKLEMTGYYANVRGNSSS